jgi:large subunit ribosomal protein L23
MSKHSLYQLIKDPVISEKSTACREFGQYVFNVHPLANKIELAKAFELIFPGRRVTAVQTIAVKPKQVRKGKRVGFTKRGKKAVFTVIGDSLESIGTL